MCRSKEEGEAENAGRFSPSQPSLKRAAMTIEELAAKCKSSVDELVSLLDQLAADADEIGGTNSEQQDAIRAALNDAVSRIEKTQ